MNVGIIGQIVVVNRVNNDLRLLRRGRVVQVHQRLAINLLFQDREILPNLLYIEFEGRSHIGIRRGNLLVCFHSFLLSFPLKPGLCIIRVRRPP